MQYKINNVNLNDLIIGVNDMDSLFIFAIGYETRSFHIINKLSFNLNCNNTLVFVFEDYANHLHTVAQVVKLKEAGFELNYVKYEDSEVVQKLIIKFIQKRLSKPNSLKIHIDYSSMPRSWYCRIPLILIQHLRKNDITLLWYTEGEYPETYKMYPSAGIHNFSLFSGKPSLKANNSRIHILGLGYDYIRTQAILTVIDPSFFVACYSFPSYRKDVQNNLMKANYQLLSQASMTLSLPLDDFSFMISKLCEIANEMSHKGDIIFVPDGPKPLVLAFSLVPDIINKEGITCMHISRNSDFYEPINVNPTGKIYGVSFEIN